MPRKLSKVLAYCLPLSRSAMVMLVLVCTATHAQHIYGQLLATSSLPDSPGYQQVAASSAQITGAVADVMNGIVPGASVVLLSGDTVVSEVKSDGEGHFVFTALEEGAYRIRISAPDLQSFESPTIVLKPGEHTELPTTALPIATANQSVNVVLTQAQIADQELAEQTKQRVFGVLPNFYTSYQWNAAPLNSRQKLKLTFRATTDPTAFMTAGIVAGIEQGRNTFPGYGDDALSYAKRYGAAYGDAFIGRFVGAALLPSIFRQDPRYFFMGPLSTNRQRFWHAVSFSVIARNDKGKSSPNYSHILGDFIAGYISKSYHPDSDKGITLAVNNALIGLGGAAVQGLTREFLLRRISTHTPKYAQGKPVSTSEPAKLQHSR